MAVDGEKCRISDNLSCCHSLIEEAHDVSLSDKNKIIVLYLFREEKMCWKSECAKSSRFRTMTSLNKGKICS